MPGWSCKLRDTVDAEIFNRLAISLIVGRFDFIWPQFLRNQVESKFNAIVCICSIFNFIFVVHHFLIEICHILFTFNAQGKGLYNLI